MVIVCAVSDGYYLPAPLTLLYASRLLPPSRPSFSLSYSHYILLALAASPLHCGILLPSPLSLSLTSPEYSTVLFTFCLLLPVISFVHKLSLVHKHNNVIYKAAKKPALGQLLM